MSTPASSGPSSTATSREGLSSAMASPMCFLPTMAGMSACRAGWSNVAAAVVSSTLSTTCQASTAPVNVAIVSPRATTSDTAWATWSSRRRS